VHGGGLQEDRRQDAPELVGPDQGVPWPGRSCRPRVLETTGEVLLRVQEHGPKPGRSGALHAPTPRRAPVPTATPWRRRRSMSPASEAGTRYPAGRGWRSPRAPRGTSSRSPPPPCRPRPIPRRRRGHRLHRDLQGGGGPGSGPWPGPPVRSPPRWPAPGRRARRAGSPPLFGHAKRRSASRPPAGPRPGAPSRWPGARSASPRR
jgi:hypothetical protein